MRILQVLGWLAAGAALLLGWAYWTALADPVVKRAALPLLPAGGAQAELRLLLVSDIHVAGPDMPPERLARIVAQANMLRPDLVLIAGDFVSDKRVATRRYTFREAVAPLAKLRAPLGTLAVFGNHDHWRNAVEARAELTRAGIRLLDNEAVRAGPLAVGGIDDAFTGRDDLPGTMEAMQRIGGVPVLLSHSPDPFPELPRGIPLMLAGHTHCGQIRLPLVGALSTMSRYGNRYACGVVREGVKTLVVSAGLGTSIAPLRLGAVPDMWLVTLRRAAR